VFLNPELCLQTKNTPVVLRRADEIKLVGGGYLVDPERLKKGRQKIGRGHRERAEFIRGLWEKQ
jgi:hypothetical protein